MASTPRSSSTLGIFVIAYYMVVTAFAVENLNQNIDLTWSNGRGKIIDNGQLLTLSLDKASGSGFQSKNEYLFGKIDMQLKLVPGNSAGTVTTFYVSPPNEVFIPNLVSFTSTITSLSGSASLHQPKKTRAYVDTKTLSSQGTTHDEIDLEFLGNVTGQPYTLHTNVFTQGKGGREQQFRLWFDPTANFHTYSILWNPHSIIFSVDSTPIRVFKNMQSVGVAYPNSQPLRVYSSLWDAEDWATQGGRVKTDWSKAPFTASFRNFNADACILTNGQSSCSGSTTTAVWMNQQLDTTSQKRLQWAQKNYMIYNYCTDYQRFPQGLPKECKF